MTDARRRRVSRRAAFLHAAAASSALALVAAAPAIWGAAGPWTLILLWAAASAGLFVVQGAIRRFFDAEVRRPADPNRHPEDPFAVTRPTALLALEMAPDPMLVIDAEARIRLVNQAARDFLGRDALGKRMSAVFRSPTVLNAAKRALEGAPSCSVDYTLLVPVERHLRAHVAPVAPDGVPGLPEDERRVALVVIRDLTSQRRAERMHSDFVANASHELRTPLAALKGFIETLQGPARDDEEARERFLSIMARQAERMETLIGGLLSLSRIELYEHVPPLERSDLLDIAREAADAHRLMKPEIAARLHFDASSGLDALPVVGARDELIQVCHNLISNACKYGGDGPVELSVGLGDMVQADLQRAGGAGVFVGDMTGAAVRGEALSVYRRLTVRDHGRGVAREHLPRLTERFFQADPSDARDGTGLGLAIVKHIVNRHRGVLRIESVVDMGSAFTVFLPPPAHITGVDAPPGTKTAPIVS